MQKMSQGQHATSERGDENLEQENLMLPTI